jgi:hypothetical protein
LRSWTPTSIGSICGDELKEAETWLADQAGHKPAATPAQAQLILANRRAATRRQRGFGVTGVAVMIALAVLAAFALIQRQTAIQQRETTITRELAANSAAQAAKDPGDSMLLAVEAFHYQPTVETRGALLSSQGRYFVGKLTSHNDVVSGVAFSPDGRTVATTSTDGTAKP